MRTLLVRLGLLAPQRTFALLDTRGACIAFQQATQAPQGHGWVEVAEARLHWLGRRLPAHALLTRTHQPEPGRAFAAQ